MVWHRLRIGILRTLLACDTLEGWGCVCGTVKIGGREGTGEGIGPREKGFSQTGGYASGGAGEPGVGFQLPVPALVEVVLGHGLRHGRIELRALVEVVREVLLCDFFGAGTTEIEEELSLGRAAGGM